MKIQQKDTSERVGITLNGGALNSSINVLKSLGKIGASILFFAIVSFGSFALGNPLIGIMAIFYIISILIRIPDTYQDVFYFESVATFGLILTLIWSIPVALFFIITAEWVTRFISPFGYIEEYQETISEGIAVTAAILLSPFLLQFVSGNLLYYMIYFQLIRFAVFRFGMAIMMPAKIVTDLLESIVTIPTSILQSYLILLLLGMPVLGFFGITNWDLASIQSLF